MEKYLYLYKTTHKPQYNETSFHCHDSYELLYFISGSCELVTRAEKSLLYKGSLIFIPKKAAHRINVLDSLPYCRAVISFDSLPQFASEPEDIIIYDISKDNGVISVFDRMKDYNELFQSPQKDILFDALMTELFVLLQSRTQKEHKSYGLFMTKALEYIDRNITSIKDTDSLCEALHISKAYLYREFSAALQISPMRYINQKRLEIARELLIMGDDATKVCFRCGFSDYSAFYRAYLKYFGHCPTATAKT